MSFCSFKANKNSSKSNGYKYLIVTFPTGKDELNLFNFTPSSDPAQIILYGLSLSQKYLRDVIAFSFTWISSINIAVLFISMSIILIFLFFLLFLLDLMNY